MMSYIHIHHIMEIVKAFNSNNLHADIIIKGTHENPLFRASDIGEILEMGNIRTSIKDFNDTERDEVHTMDVMGRLQKTTFLTEKGLYKVLFKSRKPIAEQFQNWICEIIKEIRLTGKYELEKKLENTIKDFDVKITIERTLEKEKVLLEEYGVFGSIIYIIRVKTFETGEYVVKIGESRRGIENRYKEHLKNYDECLLLDIFPVKKSKDFENFIHKHEEVRINKVKTLSGHENENELFLIGNKLSYKQLLQIINANINHYTEYNNNDYEKLENEINTLKEILTLQNNTQPTGENNNNINFILQNILQEQKDLNEYNIEQNKTNKLLIEKLENLEKLFIEKLEKITPQPKITTIMGNINLTVGDKLLQINPETKQIIKVYETVADALKESNFKLKGPSIQKAVTENTIYNGCRWLYVDRTIDPTQAITTLKETKKTKSQSLGYIAKMNKEKTEIITVYLDRKTAAHQNNYTNISALDIPVKNNTITNGFYYVLYDNCKEELREKFEEKYGEPFLYKDGVGQYDATNKLIQEFSCKYDVIKKIKVSDKTLRKVLDKNIPYFNYYYKTMGCKLSQGIM